MTQDLGELLARFQSARDQLTLVLNANNDDGSLRKADLELSSSFDLILQAQLTTDDAKVARIEFLLGEIGSASEENSLIRRMAETVSMDVKDVQGR